MGAPCGALMNGTPVEVLDFMILIFETRSLGMKSGTVGLTMADDDAESGWLGCVRTWGCGWGRLAGRR